MALKQACETDHESAMLILQMTEIFMESNSLMVCIDTDGNRYEIPPYVINKPVSFMDDPTV